MKYKYIFLTIWFLLIAISFVYVACDSHNQPISSADNIINLKAPAAFGGGNIPYPERNPFTSAGLELGEKLFFDPRLSVNGKVSCASCHLPKRAFTDGRSRSDGGATNQPLERNAPTLFNLAWVEKGLFWDGGARDLESQVFGPLQHPDEMGMPLAELAAKLMAMPEYRTRFQQTFGQDTVHSAYIGRALAQYQRSLVSANSHYDKVMLRQATFSELELKGKALFEANCQSCHTPPFFTDHAFHNNGLNSQFPNDWENPGQGRYRITLQPSDMGKFKTPTLRNIAITAPYMHDGRFSTLVEVLAHYSSGIKPSETLAPELSNADSLGLALTPEDQKAVIAFLLTLTDERY